MTTRRGLQRLNLDRAVEMAADFHKHHNPPWPFVETDMRNTLDYVRSTGLLKVSATGFIAATLQNSPVSRGWLVANELFWWRDADLIRAFRKWAIGKGANEIRYSCPFDSRVQGFYSKFSTASEAVYSEYP